MAGTRIGKLATSGKIRIRVVRASKSAINAHVSRKRHWYGWSWIPTRSSPSVSARLTVVRVCRRSAAVGTTLIPNSIGLP